MNKKIMCGLLFLAVLGVYLTLTLTNHPAQANGLGEFAGVVLAVWFFSGGLAG